MNTCITVKKSLEILKKYWGHDNFRPLQEDIIDSCLNGHDVLALLPTGGGKSVCFQIPGMAREGLTLVISPLIALMQDQVQNLQKKGIRAKELISGMSYREIDILLDNARFGGLDFLYTSPERLQTKLFIERIKLTNLGLIVVDEAHCISEWGHDFRPSYLQIGMLREIHPETPIIAVTATATLKVVDDIVKQLQLNKPEIYEASFLRENIAYNVHKTNTKLNDIVAYIEKHKEQSGIVYCQTRKSVKEVTKALLSLENSVGLYHGGMTKEERKLMLDKWMSGEIKVMVCTNAFGMGIDKGDVRFVLHYEFPDNLEAFFQESGRAGRDENEAESIVYYQESDISALKLSAESRFPPIDEIKRLYRALCSYLKVAIGSGKNETYNLDFKEFVQIFKLKYLESYHGLKMLELNGDIVFSEGVFHPTKIRIAVNNMALYNFQIKNEKYNQFIELIARSYPGIHDFFYQIDEKEIAKRLKLGEGEITSMLQYLEKAGIFDISWQSSLPTLTFEHERLPDDYLRISNEIYHSRKELYFDRLEKAINYLQSDKCRVQQMLNYFGQETEPCGKCDNCEHKDYLKEFPTKEINSLMTFLASPKTIEEIASNFKISQSFTKKILFNMVLKSILMENEGLYSVKSSKN